MAAPQPWQSSTAPTLPHSTPHDPPSSLPHPTSSLPLTPPPPSPPTRFRDHLSASAPTPARVTDSESDSLGDAWVGGSGGRVEVVRLQVGKASAPLTFNMTEDYAIEVGESV